MKSPVRVGGVVQVQGDAAGQLKLAAVGAALGRTAVILHMAQAEAALAGHCQCTVVAIGQAVDQRLCRLGVQPGAADYQARGVAAAGIDITQAVAGGTAGVVGQVDGGAVEQQVLVGRAEHAAQAQRQRGDALADLAGVDLGIAEQLHRGAGVDVGGLRDHRSVQRRGGVVGQQQFQGLHLALQFAVAGAGLQLHGAGFAAGGAVAVEQALHHGVGLGLGQRGGEGQGQGAGVVVDQGADLLAILEQVVAGQAPAVAVGEAEVVFLAGSTRTADGQAGAGVVAGTPARRSRLASLRRSGAVKAIWLPLM
ncbi:hypothetical protein G3435_17930 [Pseudomonas sp. MAFF212428]|uniref:Uncharacterized protein n=1 Tax=Pseudomonas brassicae TaxID=2708063 RepID=A0A6M0CUP3_9PSED|nr:hypothetical protein [Pseudomonas brassicae]